MTRTVKAPRSPAASTGKPARTAARTGEAAILAAGTVFAALLVVASSAYGAPDSTGDTGHNTDLQLAAADAAHAPAPAARVPAGGLDLSLPAAAPDTPPAAPTRRDARLWDGTVALDANTRLRGVYRLQIDLYPDDMQPRGGAAPR